MRKLFYEKLNSRVVKGACGVSVNGAKKKNRGFILIYTVMFMTFIVTLIGVAVSTLQSTSALSQKVGNKYAQDTAFYQIEEYIAAGYYATAGDYALNNGFMLDVKSEAESETGANVFEVTVYQGSRVRLYILKRNGEVVKYVYGEDKG